MTHPSWPLPLATPKLLELVGPKGYIHGWIRVGPGASVESAKAGDKIKWSLNGNRYTGTVTKHDTEKPYLWVKPQGFEEQTLSKKLVTHVKPVAQ